MHRALTLIQQITSVHAELNHMNKPSMKLIITLKLDTYLNFQLSIPRELGKKKKKKRASFHHCFSYVIAALAEQDMSLFRMIMFKKVSLLASLYRCQYI